MVEKRDMEEVYELNTQECDVIVLVTDGMYVIFIAFYNR